MRTEYKRDMNHSYMVLQGIGQVDTSSYQIRMLAGNVIPKLLKCRLQGVDGKTIFSYEITSRQPVSSLFENKKLNIEELQLIFGGFVQVMEEMAEFLLNPENLVISPEHMYVDIEKKELYFCYLPGYEHEVREQFQILTEYVLPKLNHEDAKAVMLGYGVYRRALEESFHLENIKEELYRVRGENNENSRIIKKEEKALEEENIPEIFWEKEELPKMEEVNPWKADLKETVSSDKEEKHQGIKKAAGCAAAAALILGMVFLKAFGYLPWLTVEAMAGIFLVLLGLGTLIYFAYTKRKKKNIPQKETMSEKMNHSSADSLRKTELEEIENLIKDQERKKQAREEVPQEFGETVVLSANVERGPASLVSREPGELATIYLKDEITVVGKLETAADAVIPLPTVSRVHAKIRKREEEYYLCDLNSRNGTSVNGRMLKNEEEYLLQDEDEVDFAQARYVFLK